MQTTLKHLDNGLIYLSSWTPPYRAENLRKLFKRVKRVADKRGIMFESTIKPPIMVTSRKGAPGSFLDYTTDEYMRYECPVELTHGPLTNSGWHPLAVLEPMQHGVVDSPVVINKMPNADEGDLIKHVPKVWNGYCDHCNTKRRRKQTVLVRSEVDGEVRQVGSSCLFDYTGIDPELLARLYAYYGSIECRTDSEYSGWNMGWVPSKEYPLYDFLVTLGRWLGVKNQYVQGAGKVVFHSHLSDDGMQLISNSVDLHGKRFWIHDLAEESVGEEFAEEALNMLQMVKPRNSFDYNLVTVFQSGVVVKKTAGYAGAIWIKWFNLTEKGVLDRIFGRNVEEENQEPHPSQHLGEKGERIEFTCTVVQTKAMGEGMWGPTTLVTMQDEHQNQIITWSTGKIPRSGSHILARGTVKKHGEYQGIKQTQVGRLWFKLIED